jgi:hypothetical protein
VPKNRLPDAATQLEGLDDFVHTVMQSSPGQPDSELVPYKGTEFHVKSQSGVSIEFQRDASGAVTEALATLPYGVFHASKKA